MKIELKITSINKFALIESGGSICLQVGHNDDRFIFAAVISTQFEVQIATKHSNNKAHPNAFGNVFWGGGGGGVPNF